MKVKSESEVAQSCPTLTIDSCINRGELMNRYLLDRGRQMHEQLEKMFAFLNSFSPLYVLQRFFKPWDCATIGCGICW